MLKGANCSLSLLTYFLIIHQFSAAHVKFIISCNYRKVEYFCIEDPWTSCDYSTSYCMKWIQTKKRRAGSFCRSLCHTDFYVCFGAVHLRCCAASKNKKAIFIQSISSSRPERVSSSLKLHGEQSIVLLAERLYDYTQD